MMPRRSVTPDGAETRILVEFVPGPHILATSREPLATSGHNNLPGRGVGEIADQLVISPWTVEKHVPI